MKKYIYILHIYISMAYKVYWLNMKHTNKLIKELNQVLKKTGGSLNKAQIKRIKFYTDLNCITNSWFCTLRGQKTIAEEEMYAIYLGAITPLLDDLTDSLKLTSVEIMEKLNSSDDTTSDEMVLARYIYAQLTNNRNEDFYNAVEEALVAQDTSLKQLEKDKLNDKELKNITYVKGCTSTLLYRIILCNQLKSGEKEAIYSLGYLLQLTNDMFDVYKDYHKKQQTLYTNSTDLIQLYHEYKTTLDKMILQFMYLDYDYKNIKKCLCEISTITSRGMVCSDQLLLCQKKTNGIFKIGQYTRKQLKCDMEKLSNIIKSINYSIHFYNQLKLLTIKLQ